MTVNPFELEISVSDIDWNRGIYHSDDPHRYGIVVFLVLTYIMGTPLLSVIIQYEKYGEDPKKRSLLNQVK